MEKFEIPVVMILFKRVDKSLEILNRISQIQPQKLYLLSDEGRNEEEKRLVKECRELIEKNITWDCEVIKYYASENRGVYENIGIGAQWVFEREKWAIFLEDDNLPEITFFDYCRDLLYKYRDDNRILWVCGTNYLGKYDSEGDESYMFTKHLLPCGWASWSHKFLRYYDGELELAENKEIVNNVRYEYESKALYKQQMVNINRELKRKHTSEKFSSWDYQMAFTIRAENLYGISPRFNQIKNIGVDEYSEHGGTSFDNIMTERFCGMESYPLHFPLVHPKTVLVDRTYESKITNIILYPLSIRIKNYIGRIIKKILGIDVNDSILEVMREFFRRNNK